VRRRNATRRRLEAVAVPAAAVILGAAIGIGSPLLLLVALLPVAAAVVLRPDGAVVIFAFGFYLNLPVVLAQHTGISTTLASGFAALLLLPVFGYLVMGRQPLVVTPVLGLMVGYLVALVLSATLAPGAGPGTNGTVTTFLTEGLLLFLLVTNAVRTPRTLRLVLWAVTLAAGASGLISVWQEATGSYSNHLFGLAQVDLTGFNIGTDVTGKALRPRLAGPIGEKNRYAQMLLVLLPLAVFLARTERRRGMQILGGLAGALTLCGVLLTFSRGAAVAVGVMVVAMGVTGFVRARTLIAMAVVVIGIATAIAPDYISRVQTLGAADSALSQGSAADAAVVGRATENLAALNAWADHPVLGVGPGQYFKQYSQQYGNALNLRFLENNRRAHNLYLEIAADTGALGLGLFLALLIVTILQLWRLNVLWRDVRPQYAQLALAFIVSIVGYMASGIFLQLSYQRYFFFLLALANATAWILRREALRARLVPA
jgi:O-antigen ligase